MNFGEFGLMSLDYGWINGRHIEVVNEIFRTARAAYELLSDSARRYQDERAYGEGPWDSGAQVVSEAEGGAWTVHLAFPLERLVPDGAQPGQTLYMNILRGGEENLVWSPTFENGFHVLGQFGEVVLE